MPYTYQKNASGQFVCTICSEVKKNQNTMHYHMKKHEGHLPFTCPTCKKEFLHAQTLAVHVAAKHSKEDSAQLKCPCCPYKTLTKANRTLHFMRKHCAEEVEKMEIKDSTCPTCQKVCNSSAALLYHLSTGCIQLPAEKQKYLTELMA